MTDLTPASIVSTLANISKEIETKAEEISILDADATRKRAIYKKAFAESFLRTEASNEVRRYTAEYQTAQMLFEAELADQVLRAAKESLRVLRDRLEVGRSLGAIMRLEWSGRSD